MPRAVVFGVNGQDGSYAAEALLRKGHEVIGYGRQSASRYVPDSRAFTYRQIDLADTRAVAEALEIAVPDQAYHFAAIHGAADPSYEAEWAEMVKVNVLSLHALLQYAMRQAPGLHIVYASSAKIFGTLAGAISETTPRLTTCLYSNTKNSAFDLIAHYREKHGVHASSLILFNHESPRRPPAFFVPRVVAALAAALDDFRAVTSFRSLDFYADWSHAEDLTNAAVALCGNDEPADVVLASGVTCHGREFVAQLFDSHGLEWRRHVEEANPASRKARPFQVDISKLRSLTRPAPRRDIFTIASEMLSSKYTRNPQDATK